MASTVLHKYQQKKNLTLTQTETHEQESNCPPQWAVTAGFLLNGTSAMNVFAFFLPVRNLTQQAYMTRLNGTNLLNAQAVKFACFVSVLRFTAVHTGDSLKKKM